MQLALGVLGTLAGEVVGFPLGCADGAFRVGEEVFGLGSASSVLRRSTDEKAVLLDYEVI
jgi:hypothetical protein